MGNKINIEFQNEFNGISRNERGSVLSINENNWRPYELLFSALGGCMYSTFLDVINKKKLEYEKVLITIEGEKIDDIPSFLKNVDITFTIYGSEKENKKVAEKFGKSLKLAEKYFSVYNTLAKVAELNSTLIFQ